MAYFVPSGSVSYPSEITSMSKFEYCTAADGGSPVTIDIESNTISALPTKESSPLSLNVPFSTFPPNGELSTVEELELALSYSPAADA
jgi:hypothetical protein